MAAAGDIFVLPFFGQGHLFPAMELCKNLSSHNYNITLIIPSHVSSSIPSTFSDHSSFLHVVEISVSDTADEPGSGKKVPDNGHPLHDQNVVMGEGIKSFLSTRSGGRPTCVVVDIMMTWSKDIFVNHQIPVVSFFTTGAIASAVNYGMWKAQVGDMEPGETRVIPGLPTEMAVTFADLSRGKRGRPQRPNRPTDGKSGPPKGTMRGGSPPPGQKPSWVDKVEGSVALLINTCDELEHLFINYIAEQTKIPVWGVGPLLPEQFWKSAGSILHDHEMRSDHKSNYSEDEVIQWLESKPHGSVIYISFGSEVGPSIEEFKELAKSLEESKQPFIWVIQPGSGKTNIPRSFLGGGTQTDTDTDSKEEEEDEGYFPEGLDVKVGKRGLIITGWAPQLLILSHPSTGGFLSHCGWNSTAEAIGCGVPILAWPIGSDQFDNAKLVAKHLKIGHMISSSGGKFKKEDILAGIEKVMGDEKLRNKAKELGKEFGNGFPVSSVKGLGAFVDFISSKAT